jgi:hypothetical protein
MDAIDPIRWFDTRTPPLSAKLVGDRVYQFTLPSELGALTQVVLNITCVDAGAHGFLKAWAAHEPETSNVNFQAGEAICNTAHVKVGSDRNIKFKANRAVHLIVDIQATGSPQPAPPSSGSGFLRERIDVSGIPLEPTTTVAGPDSGVIRTWNRFGGLLTELSREIDIEADAAAAVLAIESSGTGMTSLGPVIRFENHVFFNHWGETNVAEFDDHFRPRSGSSDHMWRRSTSDAFQTVHVGEQGSEWEVYEFARSLDPSAAVKSISMGLAQIMGFNFARIGYESAEQMLAAFSVPSTGVGAQIVGFFDFVETADLTAAIRAHDWDRFAIVYNGAPEGSEKMRDYSGKMKAAYDQLRAAK